MANSTPAIRDRIKPLAGAANLSHPGLILHRLLREQGGKSDDKAQARQDVLDAARRAQRAAAEVYRPAFVRQANAWKTLLESGEEQRTSAVVRFPLATPPGVRLVIGLGSESPLETGLTLHHTYGVPLIPGSALKGLAAHYCDQVLGAADASLKKPLKKGDADLSKVYRWLFGDTDASGTITFHDAWIHPDSLLRDDAGLLPDVMTPHHGDYYGEKRYPNGERIPPTDFDSPVPVQFLSVRGVFYFTLTCADASVQGRQWLAWTADLLKTALEDWGVGGKTSSGYGRLTADAVAAFAQGSTTAPAPQGQPHAPDAGGRPPPPRPQGAVRVKVIGPHPSLKGAFFVQEEGCPRGVLQHGQPPANLPNAADEIEVYRKAGCNPQSPVYRWTPEPPPPPPQRRGGPQRGGRR